MRHGLAVILGAPGAAAASLKVMLSVPPETFVPATAARPSIGPWKEGESMSVRLAVRAGVCERGRAVLAPILDYGLLHSTGYEVSGIYSCLV